MMPGTWRPHGYVHECVMSSLSRQTDLGVPFSAVYCVRSTLDKQCVQALDSLQELSLYCFEPLIAQSVAISVFRFLLYFFIKCLCGKKLQSTKIISLRSIQISQSSIILLRRTFQKALTASQKLF